MKKILLSAVMVTCIAALFSCNSNSDDKKDVAEESNEQKFEKDAEKDADRVVDAYALNMYEIAASEAAVNKASTAEVKKLAESMITAHSKMKSEIEQMAAAKNITLPAGMAEDDQKDLSDLTEKTGLDFDTKYLDQMEEAHEDGIRKCENTSEKGEDQQLREWAAKALPELRMHKDMIESTRNMVKETKDNVKENNNKKSNDHNDHKDDGHGH